MPLTSYMRFFAEEIADCTQPGWSDLHAASVGLCLPNWDGRTPRRVAIRSLINLSDECSSYTVNPRLRQRWLVVRSDVVAVIWPQL